MNPDDDPEKRIRDLERPLTEQARELGTTGPATGWPPPPPPPPPGYYGPPMPLPSVPSSTSGIRVGWIVLALLVVGLVVGGGAIVATSLFSVNRAGTPTISGGGGTFTTATRPSRSSQPSRPTVAPTPPGPGLGPGGDVSIAGVGQNKTIACNDSAVTISGMDNNVEITGHCTHVQVSGMNNVVTVEAADTIDASGMDNKITYRSGSPKVNKSGFDNTVEQG